MSFVSDSAGPYDPGDGVGWSFVCEQFTYHVGIVALDCTVTLGAWVHRCVTLKPTGE